VHSSIAIMMSDEGYVHEVGNSGKRRRRLIYGGIFVVVLVVVVVIIVVLTAGGGGGSDAPSTGGGGNGAQSSIDLQDRIHAVLDAGDADSAAAASVAWQDPNSYQSKALSWLVSDFEGNNYLEAQLLQRYSLACLYYATYSIVTLYSETPTPWKVTTNWLSSKNECEWHGIECTYSRVTGISLIDNGLTGKLPMELVLMKTTLNSIDFSVNTLYMTGNELDVFGRLTKLHTIIMDDNYLLTTDGLPSSLQKCTDLEKINLSYNLLEGPMQQNVLSSWSKLTHMEIESNYLDGSFPSALGSLRQLVYLYMRRNNFQSNLDFVKVGNMANIFSVWLDDNSLTGTIPTEVGTLSQLASLSITNGNLTGPIPTEMGLLTGLRRVWLYGNQLSGTVPTELGSLSILEVFEIQDNDLRGRMPRPVCAAIGTSGYEHKSLLADCQQVACDNCCSLCR